MGQTRAPIHLGALSRARQVPSPVAPLRQTNDNMTKSNTYDIEPAQHGDGRRKFLELAAKQVHQVFSRRRYLLELLDMVLHISEADHLGGSPVDSWLVCAGGTSGVQGSQGLLSVVSAAHCEGLWWRVEGRVP